MSITAAILCGGQGTRLKPVLEAKGLGHLPKCVAPVAGRPFLDYVLDHLVSQAVAEIILCTRQDQCSQFPYGVDYKRVPIIYNLEQEPLGTCGALLRALPLLDSDPVLVVNGDTFCKFDLGKLLEKYKQNCGTLTSVFGHDNNEYAGVCLMPKYLIQQLPNGKNIENWLPLQWHSWYREWAIYQNFLDVGTPEGYAKTETFLREQGMINGSPT